MSCTGRDDLGSASEKRSENRARPFDGCAEWFEKMTEWLESGGGEMDCCEVMPGGRRAERGAEESDAQ